MALEKILKALFSIIKLYVSRRAKTFVHAVKNTVTIDSSLSRGVLGRVAGAVWYDTLHNGVIRIKVSVKFQTAWASSANSALGS